ncbi:MAG: OmpA family protein [Rikenellaceae bacterium]
MINMKKCIVALLLSALTIPTFATGEESTSNPYKTTSKNTKSTFDPYWYLRVQAGVGHSVGESSFSTLLSPTAALSGGYQFSPIFGARLGVSGWQAKGSVVVLDETYKYNYLQASLDFTVDIANIFMEYNEDRLFNPYVFAGIGYNYSFNNDEAVAYNADGYTLSNLWLDNQSSFVVRVGVGADFKISDRVALGLEYNINGLSDKCNSKGAENPDWQHNLLLGAKIRLGDNGKSAAAAAALAAAEAEAKAKAAEEVAAKAAAERAAREAAEKARAEAAAKEAAAKAAAAKEAAAKAPRNVIFTLDSSTLTSEGNAKVKEISALMKEYPNRKISVTGYADEETGNAKYNLNLSEKRAEIVKETLIANGISEDRIITDYKGDTVRPYAETEKNRVAIAILQ